MSFEISYYCCCRWYNDVTDVEVKVCIISPESPVSPELEF
jgi:hypothetical protein